MGLINQGFGGYFTQILPAVGGESWIATPGAAVLGGWLGTFLDRKRLPLRRRVFIGALLGAVLGILNAPISYLCADLPAVVTAPLPDLFEGLAFEVPLALVFVAPLSAPTGAAMGVMIALLCRRAPPQP